jgi:2-phospho-L-lactate guanylyltransferase
VRVVVPFGADDPKTRLADCLDPAERATFAAAMRADVLAAVREAGGDPELLANAPVDADAPVRVDDRPLSAAVNAEIRRETPVAIVMADLALATPDSLATLFGAAGDVVLAPGRGGGTNALVVRDPTFRVDYHGVSCRDHREAARAADLTLSEVDSYRLGTDVDERADLVEVLLHGDGEAAAWLAERFAVVERAGRVGVERS